VETSRHLHFNTQTFIKTNPYYNSQITPKAMKNYLPRMRTYWRLLPALLAFMLLAMSSRSQTYLSESFDGATFPPTSWTQTQVTGTGLWARSTSGFNPATTPHSGAGMAFFNCYSFSSGTSASLFTPNIDLSGASGVAVEFWMNRDAGYPTYSDNVEVLINTASSITGATSLGVINRCKTLTPVETGADGWYKYSFIIPSSFNTATNFLIFRANGLYGNCIYVDDIKVYKPLANDIQVKSVTTTPSVLSDGAAAILTATLVNQGSDAQSNVIVTFMDGATLVGTATVASIATGETKTATYGWTAAEGSHTITASVGTDDDNTNNVATYSFTVFGQNALVENFEGAWPPVGWSINPTTSSWQQYSVTPYEGSKCAYVSASAGKRLITPKLVINSGSSIMFYAKDGYGTYSIKLQYSTDKTTWTDVPSGSISLTSNYALYNISLGSIPAGNYYLAFDYELSYASVYVDYVVGPDLAVEAPAAATNPNPANAATNVVSVPSLSWSASAAGGIPTGYKLYLGTDGGGTATPTSLVNGTLQTTTSYTPAVLAYSTTYYWKVVPTNSNGDATGCPIWSFTTMADPTQPIPYSQNFDGMTSLPSFGWAVSNYSLNTTHGVGNSNCGSVEMWSSTNSATLTSAPIGPLSSTSNQLIFDYRICDFSYSAYPQYATNLGVNDKVEVQLSSDGGSSYSTVYTINQSTHEASTDFATRSITLDASYNGKTVLVRFKNTWAMGDYFVDIDNFKVRETPTNPTFSMDKSSMDFGYLPVGLQPSMILKVTNTGGGTLTINSSDVTITGASANQYAIVNTNFPLSLASGISKNIEIRFVATTGGVKNATLNIAHNAAGSPATVTLAGEAYMPFSSFTDGFETTALDGVPKGWVSNYTGFAYGGVLTTPQNAQSGSNSFGIQNSGSDFVILSTPAVTNFSTNRLTFWAKASAAASTLSVGTIADPYNSGTFASLQTVTLTTSYAQYIVDFSTYSGGAQYIAIKSGGGSTSQFIDNVVWEANPTAPMLSVNPGSINFGMVAAKNTGKVNLTVTNSGVGTLTINASDLTYSGANAAEFKIGSTTFPVILNAAESAPIEVVFAPSTAGDKTATLTVAHNGTNPSADVTLTGKGLPKGSLIETFNNPSWPAATGWTAETGWVRQTYGPYEGVGHAYISPSATATNVKLITPLLVIKSGDALTFYTKTTSIAPFPTIQVMYATAVGGPWTAIGSSISVSTSGYTQQVVDLTSLAGNNYFLAFAESGSAYKSVYLDMVTGPQVYQENVAPAFTSAPVTAAKVGHDYAYNLSAIDANYDDLTITAPVKPFWLTIADNGDGTAVLSGIPDVAGDVNVTVSVSDGTVSTDQVFTISVADNAAPVFTSTAVVAGQVGQVYSYGATSSDADGDALTITAITKPSWLTLTDNGDGTASLSGTPTVAGDYNVTLNVSDGIANEEQSFTITVAAPANNAPEFTSTAITSATVGEVYSYSVVATDADTLSITATTKPSWLILTDHGDGTATLSGTPTAAGDDNVTLNVSDGIADVEQSFTITVAAAANHAPEFTSTPIVGGEVGSAYSYSITAIDADGDALAITSLEVPTWLTLTDNGNGTASLSGTPATFGSFDVKIQVSDGKVNVEQDFTVVVVATGIADNNIQNVTVYPNPASNELYLTNADGSNLQIFDMSGKLILSAKYEGRVDVSAIPSGSYLVRIATQYGFVLRKVQIVR